MEYKTFSLRLPAELVKVLDAQALQRFRKQNGRNQIITDILLDWHQSTLSTPPPKPRTIAISRVESASRSKRKRVAA